MLSKEVNLEEAFRYPVTSVSLNLASPHSNITQNPKHHFRNYLIDVSKACESTPQMKPAGYSRYYVSHESYQSERSKQRMV